jgi:choline dehydrogenase-like flavoprotein
VLLDLRQHRGAKLEADVCVVGAGAAGLTLATALVDAGRDVLVVESGGTGLEPAVDALNDGDVIGRPFNGLNAGRRRGLGGTTRVWPGQCLRLSDVELADWPLDLDPWYEQAERLLGVPGRAPRLELPSYDPSLLEHVISVFAPRRRLEQMLGRPLVRSSRARVLVHATATALGDGVTVRDVSGAEARVVARRVVLCAGGIENARLLLASGLGGDATGRYLQDHPASTPAYIVTDTPRALQDLYGLVFRNGARWAPKLRLPEGGCIGNVVFDYGDQSPVQAVLRLRRAFRSGVVGDPRDLARIALGAPTLAGGLWRRARTGREPAPRPEAVRLLAIAEQGPDPESRITLGEPDSLGVPRPRVDWRIGEEVRTAVERLVTCVRDEFARLGLGEVVSDEGEVHDSFHHAGTTRMGDVVDRDCRVGGTDSLYVCGSSVFPRSGCANPTLTIIGLALRLAEHLA